jgi:curved DNA-binding protein
MDFKDYYATLGVAPSATHEQIKHAYRKLARKFHPDVSKEPDAEARFKDVAEAHEALIDTERRAAYDALQQRRARGEPIDPPPGWQGSAAAGGEASHDFSAFFEAMFGQDARPGSGTGRPRRTGTSTRQRPGDDQHGDIQISLEEAFAGAQRLVSLHLPVVEGNGRASLQLRQLQVHIPAGVRPGQQLRLAGQGGPGQGGGAAGDLYLAVAITPHPVFRLDQRDLYFDLPLAPWEAALGASVPAPTPQGPVQLTIPPGSLPGRQLRLKGRGLPGQPAGDLYAVLGITLPSAATAAEQGAYSALAAAFPGFNPRQALPP